jgi:general secretion pathway protein M
MAALSQMSLPEGSRGRMLAVGVTLAALAFIWIGAVQPLIDLYDQGADDLAQRRALAGRSEDVAGTLPALKREARAVASVAPPPTATLEGASDAIAAASLQGMLEAMTQKAGAHLTSAEALPAEQVGAYRRVSLRVSVDATWPTLIHLLQSIERATPHMFVDELQLHAQPTSEKVRELPLDISFTLLAFRSATGVPPAAGAAEPGPTDGADAGAASDSGGDQP